MGRGLSDLQQRILTAAYKRRDDEPIKLRAEAFWCAPKWLFDLGIKLYDAQKHYWRSGFLATCYLAESDGGGWDDAGCNSKYAAVWNIEILITAMIKRAVEAAKEAGDPSAKYLDKIPGGYTTLVTKLRRWHELQMAPALVEGDEKSDAKGLAMMLGMDAVNEFVLSVQPETFRGHLGWTVSSSAEFADHLEAEAARIKLRTALSGFEQFGGDWISYSSGFSKITYNELLAGLFGFTMSGSIDGQAFDVQAIGAERYNVARASVQRACLRLEQRGLIDRRKQNYEGRLYQRAGINLTVAGVSDVEAAMHRSAAA